MTLVVSESYINATKHTRFADSDWYEPYTDKIGDLYRDMVKEYGRCTGHVYVDTASGECVPVGWVFIKRMEYEDARRSEPREDRTYLREVWVTVGERDERGGVWRYNVVKRKGSIPDPLPTRPDGLLTALH